MQDNKLKPNDKRIIISNPAPVGYSFTGWTGDIQYLQNPLSASTIVTMANTNVTVTAIHILNQMSNIYYGYLYNDYVVRDARNITSVGWEVGSLAQFDALATFCGGIPVAGKKLKSVSYGGTNDYGFNALSAGERNKNSGYGAEWGINSTYWTSTQINGSYSYYKRLWGDDKFDTYSNYPLQTGYSIRLIKTTTTLTHGQSGIYIGNDGKVYPTICINNQEWLAVNLAETKYRDFSIIPTVTDWTTWGGLITGGKCALNNNESNV